MCEVGLLRRVMLAGLLAAAGPVTLSAQSPTPANMLSFIQQHAQGHPEWAQCQAGDEVACHRFVRSVVQAANPSCDPMSWGLLSKSPGENQCTLTQCGPLGGEGYALDAITWQAAPGAETVYDIIGGAGGPNPVLQMLQVERRPNNRWACYWQLEVPGAPTITTPAPGETINTTLAYIAWEGDPHSQYEVQINTASQPDTGVAWTSGIVNSGRNFAWTGTLQNNRVYYAFVRLSNGTQFGPWSTGRQFTVNTAFEPPGPNIVRLAGNTLVDNNGPFNGLGATYMQELRRCKYDRPRFQSDLAFLASKGFKYIRILSMVGWYPAWQGREIAPVSFTSQNGTFVPAWPDYWQQFRDCIDIAYDQYGLRTELTIFADAQLMPTKAARINHMQMVLDNLVGREHKIMHLEVCNEAWQNGFPGAQGVADLREFCKYLTDRTELLVAISDSQGEGTPTLELYAGSTADIVTEHFSRDIHTIEGGWLPVRDCWHAESLRISGGLPPFSSNEPIGPGASVNSENDPIKLVMAAAFAWGAHLPLYVFHSEAGVFGNTTFQSSAGVGDYVHLDVILPPDLASWIRFDGREEGSPFTSFSNGQPDKWWPEVSGSASGAVRHTAAIKGGEFVSFPIGIQNTLQLQARRPMQFNVYNPLTGEVVSSHTLEAGQQVNLPQGPRAYIIRGVFTDVINPSADVCIDLGNPDAISGITHPQGEDGDTIPFAIGERTARRNAVPSNDHYFYFNVSDAWAYQGSKPDLYITISYYDTGSGSLVLEYDATGESIESIFKDATENVVLTGTQTWKSYTWHVTDAYFGNRQNYGGDFRVGSPNNTFYTDTVCVSTEAPVPPVINPVTPDPDPILNGTPYSKVLTLAQGHPAPTWSVLQGPPGLTVDAAGQVSGWTPGPGVFGRVPIQIQASNSEGSDVAAWEVLVLSRTDFDADGDTDLADFALLQRCYSGDAVLRPPGCEPMDLDHDLDVDQLDFAHFVSCMNGSNLDPGC